jgi:hypothetical protein
VSCGSAIILKSGFVKVLRASRRSESVIGAGGVKKQGFVCAIVIGPLCLVDDFKIKFCENTPRRQEIRIRSEGGGQKKARIFCARFFARAGGEKSENFCAFQ